MLMFCQYIRHQTVSLQSNSNYLVPHSFTAVITAGEAIFQIIQFQLLTLSDTSANHINHCHLVCWRRYFYCLFLTFHFAKLMSRLHKINLEAPKIGCQLSVYWLHSASPLLSFSFWCLRTQLSLLCICLSVDSFFPTSSTHYVSSLIFVCVPWVSVFAHFLLPTWILFAVS